MRALAVRLRDFRSHERAELRLGDGLTVLAGPNGAGKTNLLEGLYFGLTGRSCRTANEREVVRFGAKVTRAEVEVEDDDGRHLLEVGFQPGEAKHLRVDGAPVERFGPDVPRPLVSVFLPERLELVRGGPSGRRAHLDQFAAALHPAVTDTRGRYARALAQRNALLARGGGGASLDAWDAELATVGIDLMAARREAAATLTEPFARLGAELGLAGAPEVSYRPRSHAVDVPGLVEELRERRAADQQRGFSVHGPHRDELLLALDGRALRAYGSQGQQRAALLALLFAEREVLLERRERAPLMLLDDVMSELDATRRARLSDLLRSGGQSLVTATEPEHVPGADEDDVACVLVEEVPA